MSTSSSAPTPGELAHRAKDEARDAGYERAGLFLLLIDPNDAARVLRALDDREIAGICGVIARLGMVSERDARRVMEEYGVHCSVPAAATGGPAAARRLLTAAFDAAHAERLLRRIRQETA